MDSKDVRYGAIKSLIEAGKLNSFKDIFTLLPITVLKADMKANYSTLRRRVSNPNLLTVKDIRGIAKLIEIKETAILELILKDLSLKASARKK